MFWRTARQRLQMLTNAARRLLGPSALDWWYNRDHVRWLARRVREDGLEALQRTNAEEGFVSTPADGLGAGFTATGRLSALLAPHTGFTHQVPHFAGTGGDGVAGTDGDALAGSKGGKPMEGSFGGLAIGSDHDRGSVGDSDDVRWLVGDAFDHRVAYRDGTGVLDVEYAGRDLHVSEAAYVYPGSGTLVRDFAVENVSGDRLSGAFRYHTRANANDNGQTFLVWNANWNRLVADGGLVWHDLEGPYSLRVDARAERGGAGPSGSQNRSRSIAGSDDSIVDYETTRGLGWGDSTVGRYLDGRLSVPLDLPPGGVERVSVFVRAGEDPSPELPSFESTQRGRQAAVAEWWDDWLADVETDGIDDRFARPYVRSAVTLGMLADPETGSLPAAPNLQPMYYPSWVRDGAFAAIALAKVGKPDLARQWLAEFCPAVQERDGSFKQCYDASGAFAGVVEVEHDQQPLFAWAVAEIHEETGDEEFLDAAWPAVREALEYTRAAMDDDGLLAATPDIAEYPTDVRQSLWTNTFAYRGFRAGAALAEAVGADPEPYRQAAETVGDAVAAELFGEDGYATYRDVAGSHKEPMPYDACAIYPTGWAGSYGETERLSADLRETAAVDGGDWIPGALLLAATFYRLGEESVGDSVLDDVRSETTAAGHLVERPGGEEGHRFASPLAWSHAAFIHAVEATPGVMADGGEGESES